MRRTLALLLAVCCVLSGTALAVPNAERSGVPAARPATPATNTSEYLTISPDALETGAYRRATLDVSGTLALDGRGLNGRFEQFVLDARFDATESTTARRDQLTETATRIEARIGQLRERQSAAIRGYNNGSLPAREFVLELARIDTAAGRLETAADRVAERASSIPQFTIDGQPAVNWARNRRVELGSLEGPVRERITEALRGENTESIDGTAPTGLKDIGPTRSERLEPLQLYVETSSNGVVLAAVDEGRYYREAYLPSERTNTTASGLGDITDALDRVRERYPWTWNHSASTDSSGDRRAGIYEFALYHDHGQLTTYLDRDSGQVFAEQQRKRLMSVPTTRSVNDTAGNLRLQVNRTHPTGPLELSLSTTEGEPVDGHISIGNQSIGQTGTDGHRWTVAPRGTITVVAQANEETVRVAMNATPQSNQTALTLPDTRTSPGER